MYQKQMSGTCKKLERPKGEKMDLMCIFRFDISWMRANCKFKFTPFGNYIRSDDRGFAFVQEPQILVMLFV